MRDYYDSRTAGEKILAWVVAPFWVVGVFIWWMLKFIGRLVSDVFKSFYGKLVAFLGGLAFLYFMAYISGLIK